MELVAWLFVFALVNFVLSMLIAPPKRSNPRTPEKNGFGLHVTPFCLSNYWFYQ